MYMNIIKHLKAINKSGGVSITKNLNIEKHAKDKLKQKEQ